ncbi:hypothetical protein GPN2_10232 [Streptomyces murinus]
MTEARAVGVQGGLGAAGAAQEVAQEAAEVGQIARGARAFQEAEGSDVVLLGGLGVPGVLGDDAEQPVRGGGVHRAALGGEVAQHPLQEGGGLRGAVQAVQHIGQFHRGLAAVEGGTGLREHGERLPQLRLSSVQLAVLGVHIAAHPVAVGQFGAQLELAVQLGGLGEGGVGLGGAALGEQGAGHRAVHPGDQRRVPRAWGERERELGGLGGARVGAHVQVGADDAGVQEQQRVRVVQTAPVEFVEGGFQEVDGVPEFARQIVGDRPAAHGGGTGRGGGVREAFLGTLEVPVGARQLAGFQGAFAEPQQRGRLLARQAVRLRLGQQFGVPSRRLLGPPVRERPPGLGEPQPQLGREMGGAAQGQFLEAHAEPPRDVPQRLVGGAHPARLQGGDVRRCVGRFGQLPLGQPALAAQPLHPSPHRLRIVPLTHRRNPQLARRTLPFGSECL